MKVGEELTIENEFEKLIIKRKPGSVLHVTKHIYSQRQGHDSVITGNGWMVWKFRQVNCQLEVKRGMDSITLDNSMNLFTPPCSIVPYYKGPGTVTIEMLGRMYDAPTSLGEQPFIFKTSANDLPDNADKLEDYVLRGTDKSIIGPNASAIARRCRETIAASYWDSSGISEIARQLSCSHTVMSRQFKQAYGLSPSQFQQHLRVVDSMRLMILCDDSVATAAIGVGYESRSKYNQAFRRILRVNPSTYRP